MSGIFISYRREDSRSAAGRLTDFLERDFGTEEIFRDVETLEPGVDFEVAIRKALARCKLVLVLIGPRWLSVTDAQQRRRLDKEDDWVRLEIQIALQRNIPVIPVLVDGATPPDAQDLPDALRPLARREAQELTDKRWDYDVGQLAAVIERILGKRRRKPTPEDARDGAGGSPLARKVLLWGGVAMLALAALSWLEDYGALDFGDDSAYEPAPPIQPDYEPVPVMPVSSGMPSGTATSQCGCWGYVALGATRPNPQCASGVDAAISCAGLCPAGGAQWQSICQ